MQKDTQIQRDIINTKRVLSLTILQAHLSQIPDQEGFLTGTVVVYLEIDTIFQS